MRMLLAVLSLAIVASAVQAQQLPQPFAGGYQGNQTVPGLGALHPMHQYMAPYYMYSPREFATLSSPTYTHTWVPAYRLPPYQQSAYDYWHRNAYGPYMRATGYTIP